MRSFPAEKGQVQVAAAGLQLLVCSQCQKAAEPADGLQCQRLMPGRGPDLALLDCHTQQHSATTTATSQPALHLGTAVLPDCTCALFNAQEVWVAAQALLDVIRDVLPCPTCRQDQNSTRMSHGLAWLTAAK